MKDIGQFAPIQAGDIPEIVPPGPTTPPKDTPQAPNDVSALSKNDTLAHTDAKHAKLEHKVTFVDGQAVTDTPTTTTPAPETESGETESSETPTGTGSSTPETETPPTATPTTETSTTETPPPATPPTTGTMKPPKGHAVPEALKFLDADLMALVSDALNHCKDQNYKAAMDIIDKAIASHHKMMEANARKDKQEAPIIAAKKAAVALNQLRAKFVAEAAAAKAADGRKIAP
jgi:hypothetical protein